MVPPAPWGEAALEGTPLALRVLLARADEAVALVALPAVRVLLALGDEVVVLGTLGLRVVRWGGIVEEPLGIASALRGVLSVEHGVLEMVTVRLTEDAFLGATDPHPGR